MLLKDFDLAMRQWMAIDEMSGVDISLNGIQVGHLDKEINKAAFALDACAGSFSAAADKGAELLFVHHGLFWGRNELLTGVMYDRIKFLIEHDMVLYAVHLPLDMHPEFGINREIARMLDLTGVEPFGEFRRKKVGCKGLLPESLGIEDIAGKLFGEWDSSVRLLPFGPQKIKSVGIIAGSAARDVADAIDQDLDLFITGESSHAVYHLCMEAGINVIYGGHYRTETCGVRLLSTLVREKLNLETFFIDIPTGY